MGAVEGSGGGGRVEVRLRVILLAGVHDWLRHAGRCFVTVRDTLRVTLSMTHWSVRYSDHVHPRKPIRSLFLFHSLRRGE